MADNDAQLELKKRARRRLIGAVALALAAAIFLPMVMDSEPRHTGNELQIRIPSQEGSNYTSRTISTGTGSSSAQIAVPSDPEMSPVSVTSGPRTATTASAPAPQAAPQASSSASSVKATASTPAEEPSAEARAKALLEQGKEPESKFFVQIGVYREADNAKSVAAKVKQAGMVPSVEKVGASTRVRVGPFKTKAAAEQAVSKLKKVSLGGVVSGK